MPNSQKIPRLHLGKSADNDYVIILVAENQFVRNLGPSILQLA
jgi:hypothetical protein